MTEVQAITGCTSIIITANTTREINIFFMAGMFLIYYMLIISPFLEVLNAILQESHKSVLV
jgi:hypothetical protein